jgi:cytochrome c peroxidase
MQRTKSLSLMALCVIAGTMAGCAAKTQPTPSAQGPMAEAANPHLGYSLLAFTATGSKGNPFSGATLFNNPVSEVRDATVKTNGRSCATCHVVGDQFALAARSAFAASPDSPLITQLLADADPDVDVTSPQGQKLEAVMLDQLRNLGFIRVVLPNPNYDASQAEGDDNPKFLRLFRAVPTVFNSALGQQETHDTSEGSTFVGFTMWDGREPSLEHQAASATMGHAQGGLKFAAVQVEKAIRQFFEQRRIAGDIAAFEKKVLSQPQVLASLNWQLPERNKALDGTIFEGAPVFDEATVKDKFFKTVNLTTDAQKRGLKVFTGTPSKPACIVCHNQPETLAGGTELFRSANVSEENTHPRLNPADANTRQLLEAFGFNFNLPVEPEPELDIAADGLEAPHQVQQLPVIKFKLKDKDGAWHTVVTPDPGLAGQTGKFEDLNKFKVSQLRGIGDADRFFHDNHEREMEGAIQHYVNDFPELFGHLTSSELADLLAFMKAL